MARRSSAGVQLLFGSFLAACGSDGPAAPRQAIECDAVAIALTPLSGTTRSEPCVAVGGGGATYLVVPQFAMRATNPERTDFRLGALAGGTAALASEAVAPSERGIAARFDARLRGLERGLSVEPSVRTAIAQRERANLALAAAPIDSVRTFRVLASLTSNTFTSSTARLRYQGDNVLIYVDEAAPAGFSQSELTALGDVFDDTFYGIGRDAFGAESDIDGNGRIVVLMTHLINQLTPRAECSTLGFVTGYFFGFDISSSSANSNRGEVFYSLVPDAGGAVSCPHTVEQVKRLVPPTFVHEFQHMISFNQHVVVRGRGSEEVWLNEGLSHIAEELASKHYENLYPPPLGRSGPAQLFPDSSQGFITGNLISAYDYLAASTQYSVTTFDAFGSLKERGAAWLFLRWLGDQKGDAIYGRLVQSSATGIANVEAQSGEPFTRLFGDFGISTWTDSLPGQPRAAIPARYRFSSRNLRRLFARLYQTGAVSQEYPIRLTALACGASVNGGMVQGTSSYYRLDTDAGCANAVVHLSTRDGRALAASLRAQLGIFRLP